MAGGSQACCVDALQVANAPHGGLNGLQGPAVEGRSVDAQVMTASSMHESIVLNGKL